MDNEKEISAETSDSSAQDSEKCFEQQWQQDGTKSHAFPNNWVIILPTVWVIILLAFLIPGLERHFAKYDSPSPNKLYEVMIFGAVAFGGGGLYGILILTPLLFASNEFLTETPRGLYWMKVSGLKDPSSTSVFRVIVAFILLASFIAFYAGSSLPFAFFFGEE